MKRFMTCAVIDGDCSLLFLLVRLIMLYLLYDTGRAIALEQYRQTEHIP
jgi:hypothetical protein